MSSFDPKLQNFTILGADGRTPINISMVVVDATRVRLTTIGISMGVQLGLCLMVLMTLVLLLPSARMRRPVIMLQLVSLTVAILRIILIIQYFPGPTSELYVVWTKDRGALGNGLFDTLLAGSAFGVVQFALIEAALIMQSWSLMKTWPQWGKYVVGISAVMLAVATIIVKSLWVLHLTWAFKIMTLPIPLDTVGQAATVLGGVSIFYFCGIFALDLSVHLITTRGILQRFHHGLSSLEILAIGNGVLMVLPCIFAGLDVAAGLRGTRVVPIDAGSWVMTLVSAGLPLIGFVARSRGLPATRSSRQPSLRLPLWRDTALTQISSKPRISQAEHSKATRSAFGTGSTASAEATRPRSTRGGRRHSMFERPDYGDRTLDLELGFQGQTNVSAVVMDVHVHDKGQTI